MDDPAGVVRRYLEIVADVRSTADALLEVLDPDVRVVERSNAINPRELVRDREGALATGVSREHETFDCYERLRTAAGRT